MRFDQTMVRDLAERIILSHAEDIDFVSINEMVGDDIEEGLLFDVTMDDLDDLAAEVDKAISDARVAVRWE
jgi:hypothetical protein